MGKRKRLMAERLKETKKQAPERDQEADRYR